jgi:hypothetical protein
MVDGHRVRPVTRSRGAFLEPHLRGLVTRALRPSEVIGACCYHVGCTRESFGVPGGEGVRARRLAVLVLRGEGFSFPEVGRMLGYADHTGAKAMEDTATAVDWGEARSIAWKLVARLVAA